MVHIQNQLEYGTPRLSSEVVGGSILYACLITVNVALKKVFTSPGSVLNDKVLDPCVLSTY